MGRLRKKLTPLLKTRLRTLTWVYMILSMFADVSAEIYYVSPTGKDTERGTSPQASWKTFTHAMSKLQPGDELVLGDGTYLQELYIDKKFGNPGNPIRIRAANDGQAVVDGEFKRKVLYVSGSHDIIVQGVIFQNSGDGHVASLLYSERITLQRVSAYNSKEDNTHVFALHRCKNCLFEDCVSGGIGRNPYIIYESDYITVRRCYARFLQNSNPARGGPGIMQVYGSSHCIVENCVGTLDPKHNIAGFTGISIWATSGQTASYNRLLGNVLYDMDSTGHTNHFDVSAMDRQQTGNMMLNNVAIDNPIGILWADDDTFTVNRMTLVNNAFGAVTYRDAEYGPPYGPESKSSIKPTIRSSMRFKNSIVLNTNTAINNRGNADYEESYCKNAIKGLYFKGFLHDYNRYHRIGTFYIRNEAEGKGSGNLSPHESYDDPEYDTLRFGKGAYLIAPQKFRGKGKNGADIGAEVLYRYVDGKLTDQPLWPWPTEDRVMSELGVSVTWEKNGGLWKTLDGVYPSSHKDRRVRGQGLRE